MLVAAAVGFGVRLAFGFGYWVGKPLTHDEHEYLTLAANLAEGRGFTYGAAPAEGEERFSRPPLYPVFLAFLARTPLREDDRASAIRRAKVAQAFFGAASVLLVGRLALAAGPPAGVVAAFIAALYPPLIWITAFVWSETLYSALALAAALALARAVEGARNGSSAPPPTGRLVLAGVAAGAAALTRSMGLVFTAFAAVWLVWGRPVRAALVFLVAAGLTIAPWSLSTSLVHGRPILVAADGGVNFWIGNHPLSPGEGDMAANPAIKTANRAFRERHAGLTPEALEPFYWRDAWRNIAERPLWWLGLMARKMFYLWVPVGPSYTLHSRRYYVASVLSYGLLLPLALAGIGRLRRRGARPAAAFLLAGSTLLAELAFFPSERYRIPVVDPVLVMCAAAWIAARLARSERAWRGAQP